MSLRGVWVINPECDLGNGKKGSKVIFSRRWLTVERRAKSTDLSSYSPIPSDGELCAAVLLHCAEPAAEFAVTCNCCSISQPYPIYKLFDGQLWPVVCFQKGGLLFVSVPLRDDSSTSSLEYLESPAISTSLYLLDSIASILGDDCKELNENSNKFDEVYQFLCLCSSFGSPLEINAPAVSSIIQLSKANRPTPIPKVKIASWQSGVSRGVSKLTITISEEIKAILYDKQDVSDVWDVSGTVQCKADLEGQHDILLTLSTPVDLPPLDHFLTHPCVQSFDSDLARHHSSDHRNRKLRFSAPIGQPFTLAHYEWSSMSFLPIRGYYQMKGDKTVKLLIQLKLHESTRNNFEYCVIHIPFYNRGPIDKVDNIVPVAVSPSLALSQDRRVIIWTIGQRFPNKGLEISLQASVHFHEYSTQESIQSKGDSFCVGANSYIDLFFKISDYTVSGCDIDTKSITLFPPSRYKLITSCELYSSQYRIWNSHGDALCTWPQLKT